MLDKFALAELLHNKSAHPLFFISRKSTRVKSRGLSPDFTLEVQSSGLKLQSQYFLYSKNLVLQKSSL